MKPNPLEILREILVEIESDDATASECSQWSHEERAEALREAIRRWQEHDRMRDATLAVMVR